MSNVPGRLVGGTECKAEGFKVANTIQSIRQLDGTIYGAKESTTKCHSVDDIAEEWKQVHGARKRKGRVETVHVEGVGAVQVLKTDMDKPAAASKASNRENGSTRQVSVLLLVCRQSCE